MPTDSEDELLAAIKGTPHFSVRFRPIDETLNIPMETLRSILSKDAVRLRGWDFPHYQADKAWNAQTHVFSTIMYEEHLELWRIYRSGQFVYFSSLWDVFRDFQSRLRTQFERNVVLANQAQKDATKGLTSFIGMIYSVTEFFVFSARLAQSLRIVDFKLDILLRNVSDWALVPGDEGIPWSGFYQCKINEIRLPAEDSHAIVEDPLAASRTALRELFESFNWNGSAGAIQHYQERFMEGRFAY